MDNRNNREIYDEYGNFKKFSLIDESKYNTFATEKLGESSLKKNNNKDERKDNLFSCISS